MCIEPVKLTEVTDKRLLKATPKGRNILIFADNSYYVYSYFEKGCRRKVSKCTRQDRMVVWVFTGILHIGLEEIYKFVFLHVENLFFLSGGLYL